MKLQNGSDNRLLVKLQNGSDNDIVTSTVSEILDSCEAPERVIQ